MLLKVWWARDAGGLAITPDSPPTPHGNTPTTPGNPHRAANPQVARCSPHAKTAATSGGHVNRRLLALGLAAIRARTAPRVIIALIEGELLPATWTPPRLDDQP